MSTKTRPREIKRRIPDGWKLKGLKTLESLTDETLCFTASIYVDGKKIGTAQNAGHGGPNSYTFVSEQVRVMAERVGKEYDPSAYGGLDVLIDDLCTDYEYQRVARKAKRDGFPVVIALHYGVFDMDIGTGDTVKMVSGTELRMFRTIESMKRLLPTYGADEYEIIASE